jgi:hypothetical protein
VADTQWQGEYERTSQECIDAAQQVATEPSPRNWPVSGLDATKWNPDGYPESLYPTVTNARLLDLEGPMLWE